jgi:CheY-like chemotaxis protein
MNERAFPMETRRDETWASREASLSAAQPRAHVLIVDDHAPSRALCADYCDLFDHTSEAVAAAREAVAALKRAPFGAVVMNVHADAWDALEVIPAIRGLPGRAGATPIIGLTAIGRGHEAQRWMGAGLCAVLPKPITAARLFAALADVLDTGADPARSWAPAR